MPSLARPAFPDDDGAVAPALADALASYASSRTTAEVVAVLAQVRMLVPVVAVRGETPADGDKEADMAAVLLTGADGRRALLAFSCLESLQRWDPQARPVPVGGADAARAAVSEGAAAIVLDVAGPVQVTVEEDDLTHLAAGHVLRKVQGGYAWTLR